MFFAKVSFSEQLYYTQFYITTNGFITLGSTAPSSTATAQLIPTATTPNNLIALCMSDLVAGTNSIRYFTTGTAPNRIFVIDFSGMSVYSSGNGSVNGQIKLYETSNRIETHITNVNHGTGTGATTPNTLGIENSTGTLAVFPAGRNNVVWDVTIPEAYRFAPSGGTVTYSWSPTSNLSSFNHCQSHGYRLNDHHDLHGNRNGNYQRLYSYGSTTVTVLSGAPVVTITPPAPSICAGASVTLTASAPGAASYSWSTGATTAFITGSPSSSTTYTVTVTDACGVTGTASATVTVNPLPMVQVTPSSATFCIGGSAVSLTASGGATYS